MMARVERGPVLPGQLTAHATIFASSSSESFHGSQGCAGGMVYALSSVMPKRHGLAWWHGAAWASLTAGFGRQTPAPVPGTLLLASISNSSWGEGGRGGRDDRRRGEGRSRRGAEWLAEEQGRGGVGEKGAHMGNTDGGGNSSGKTVVGPLSRPTSMADVGSDVEDSVESTDPVDAPGEQLAKRDVQVFCSSCRRPTEFEEVEDLVECSGCHRVFHRACYSRSHSKAERIQLPGTQHAASDDMWFHAQDCRATHTALRKAAAAGERAVALPTSTGWLSWAGGSSSGAASGSGSSSTAQAAGAEGKEAAEGQPADRWRLVWMGAGASRNAAVRQISMGQIYNVLSHSFGYSLADYNSFDAAVLLRRNGTPAAAAVLDVHGPDCAELFVVATRQSLRRQGCCRLLMRELALTLNAARVQRLVVSVDDDDDAAAALWSKLGFVPLEATTLRQLRWTLPAFGKDASQGTVYYGQELVQGKGLLS